MTSSRPPWSVLVPVLDGDITAGALADLRALVAASDVRLAIVHVVGDGEVAHGCAARHSAADDHGPARWREVAALVRPERLFVDAIAGDPARAILSQIDRFGSDLVVMGGAGPAGARHARSDRTIAQVARASHCPVVVAGAPTDRETPIRVEREPSRPAHRPGRPNAIRREHADPFRASRRAAGRRNARPEIGRATG